MFSSLLVLFLAVTTLLTSTNALAINTTHLDLPSDAFLPKRRFDPLPNPYHVPGYPIILDFDFYGRPGRDLNRQETIALCRSVQAIFTTRIQRYGDHQIPGGLKTIQLGILDFTYGSNPQFRIMRCSDIVAVMQGFLTKMEREGYLERQAIVVYRFPDGHQMETGEVDIGLSLHANA
ncbi:MAG: hypothetical protein Q9201_000381 [Fulgogasparrea decipioides]